MDVIGTRESLIALVADKIVENGPCFSIFKVLMAWLKVGESDDVKVICVGNVRFLSVIDGNQISITLPEVQ